MAKLTPRLPDASDPTPTDGDFVMGDPQGDNAGAMQLLKKAGWNPDKHRVFSIGDNVDRGPDSKGWLDNMEKYGMFSILGNHDWKHIRMGHHMLNSAMTGKANPIKPNPEMQDTIDQLGPDYLKYAVKMKDYPLYLPFEDSQGKGYLMHGGPSTNPEHTIDKQDPNMMLVRRQHPHPPKFMRGESAEYPAWQRTYKGHLGHILHGHNGTPTADYWGNPDVTSLDGSGSMGKHRLSEHANGEGWSGVHRAIRLGDRKIFESPGSPESEAHYQHLIDSGAYNDMQE